MKLVLVITHLLALGLGYLLMPSPTQVDPLLPGKEQRTRPRTIALPESENPLTHASSTDYQNLFDEVLSQPNPRGRMTRILEAWIHVDPEAAILAFSRYYDPVDSDSVLQSLRVETGSLLAEAMVRHYEELRYIEPADIKDVMADSIALLAREDLDHALRLFEELPEKTRELIYGTFVATLGGEGILAMIQKIPDSPIAAKMDQSEEFWEESCYRLWRFLPPEEFNSLFQKLDSPHALKHLTYRAMDEATKFNEHGTLIKTLSSLPQEKLTHTLVAFQNASTSRHRIIESPEFLQAVQDHNAEVLLEQIKALPSR